MRVTSVLKSRLKIRLLSNLYQSNAFAEVMLYVLARRGRKVPLFGCKELGGVILLLEICGAAVSGLWWSLRFVRELTASGLV